MVRKVKKNSLFSCFAYSLFTSKHRNSETPKQRISELLRYCATALLRYDVFTMPYLRSVYSQRALSQIPRLLSLQDRNPYSPTFGCFKRTYWLDRKSTRLNS